MRHKTSIFEVTTNQYFYGLLSNLPFKNTAGGFGESHRSDDSSLSRPTGFLFLTHKDNDK